MGRKNTLKSNPKPPPTSPPLLLPLPYVEPEPDPESDRSPRTMVLWNTMYSSRADMESPVPVQVLVPTLGLVPVLVLVPPSHACACAARVARFARALSKR